MLLDNINVDEMFETINLIKIRESTQSEPLPFTDISEILKKYGIISQVVSAALNPHIMLEHSAAYECLGRLVSR